MNKILQYLECNRIKIRFMPNEEIITHYERINNYLLEFVVRYRTYTTYFKGGDYFSPEEFECEHEIESIEDVNVYLNGVLLDIDVTEIENKLKYYLL